MAIPSRYSTIARPTISRGCARRRRPQQLVFEFQGAGNLPDSDIGHQHKLAIEFADATHITERWT
jgi:hypothetical protein